MGCLYKINFPSGKSYIGVTSKCAESRFDQHIRDAYTDKNNRQVLSAIKKYGRENCTIDTLVISNDITYLKELECRAIVAFNTKSPNGYNLTRGGDGVIEPDSGSEKIRIEKMKKTMSTPEYIENQRKIQTAVWTEERKKDRADKVRKMWENPEYRKHMSEVHKGKIFPAEQKEKMSISQKKRLNDPKEKLKSSKRFKEMWADPDFRKRRSSPKTDECFQDA